MLFYSMRARYACYMTERLHDSLIADNFQIYLGNVTSPKAPISLGLWQMNHRIISVILQLKWILSCNNN